MSYQSEEPLYVMRPQRIRHENSQSIGGVGGLGRGMKDILITGAAIGIGAIGGYYILDYIFKNLSPNGNIELAQDNDNDTQADVAQVQSNIAYTQPVFDRTTRVNSYGNTGVSAYRGRVAIPRLSTTDEFEINSDFEDPGFNQVFTDNEVIEVL